MLRLDNDVRHGAQLQRRSRLAFPQYPPRGLEHGGQLEAAVVMLSVAGLVMRFFEIDAEITRRQRREAIAIDTGDTVVHERWGEGVVLDVQGRGQDVQATVRFDEVGEKRLLVAFAPLSKKPG